MARSFRVSAVNLNIGMTGYLLTLAVFIPISGWFADRLRRAYGLRSSHGASHAEGKKGAGLRDLRLSLRGVAP